MKRGLIVAALILAALSAGWVVQNRFLMAREGEWVEVEKGDLVLGIEVTGALEAVDSNRLGPPMIRDMWRFRISMMAPEGSEVKKGQPVLAFDPSQLQKTLEMKTAERDSARKQIEKARADLAIRKEQEELALAQAEAAMKKAALKLEAPLEVQKGGLNERKQIQLEHDLARTETYHRKERLTSFAGAARLEIEMLTAREARAAAIVEETQEKIRKLTVRAPRDGTVVYLDELARRKEEGRRRPASDGDALEIPDLRSMIARGEVDEADAGGSGEPAGHAATRRPPGRRVSGHGVVDRANGPAAVAAHSPQGPQDRRRARPHRSREDAARACASGAGSRPGARRTSSSYPRKPSSRPRKGPSQCAARSAAGRPFRSSWGAGTTRTSRSSRG